MSELSDPVKEKPVRGTTNVKRIAVIALVIVAIVGLAAAAYGLLNGRLEARRKLDRATVLVQDADTALVAIDKVISAEISPELAQRAAEASKRIGATQDKLREAESLLDQARPSLDKSDRAEADNLQTSASARIDMLEKAPGLLALNEQASKSMGPAREGWQLLLDADALSLKAVASYNKLTKAGVQQSQRLNVDAGKKYVTARERLAAAESAFPAAPFEAYVAYSDLRISINAVSRSTDKAWLSGDIKKANELIKVYNRDDPKAVNAFNKLPSSPDAAIGKAYDSESATEAKAYYAARDRALAADERLR